MIQHQDAWKTPWFLRATLLTEDSGLADCLIRTPSSPRWWHCMPLSAENHLLSHHMPVMERSKSFYGVVKFIDICQDSHSVDPWYQWSYFGVGIGPAQSAVGQTFSTSHVRYFCRRLHSYRLTPRSEEAAEWLEKHTCLASLTFTSPVSSCSPSLSCGRKQDSRKQIVLKSNIP